MRWQAIVGRKVLFLAAIVTAMAWLSGPAAYGQDDGGDGGTTTNQAGVAVDANGVLTKLVVPDAGGRLMRQRVAAAQAALSYDLARPSKLRKVSLNRLEQTFRDKGGVLTDEMRYLAGLLRVRYVFFYPESGDIVLAGPAEGWVTNPTGRVVGLTSGRPVIQLQDLVVALRTFPPDGSKAGVIGCSIDPTKEGLANLQSLLRQVGSTVSGPPSRTAGNQFAAAVQRSMGMQDVRVMGVAPDTHFAQVMVEADYRMKLIGIGLEQPPVRMVSFVDRASASSISRNALFRWYFVPDYNCVRVSEDKLAMELEGDGVKLIGEDELVSGGGARQGAGRSNAASQAFVNDFTARYSALADRSPVYAELRNLIDLAIAAAFIQEQDYYGKSGWTLGLLGDETALAVNTYNAPQHVESVVTAVWKGNRLTTPVAGGVQIQPTKALEAENLLPDEQGKVARLRAAVELPEGQWWWD